MTDLTARLRAFAQGFKLGSVGGRLLVEAAVEIEQLERQRDEALAKHVMEQDTYMSAEGDPELVTYCGYCGWEPASGQPHLDVVLLTPETEASDE